jgi:hypothetical protein
LDWQRRVL